MIKKTAIFSITLIIFLYSTIQACWVFLSIQDLIAQSDTIIMGYIEGDMGETKDNNNMIQTQWEINVSHYLKGEGAYKKYAVSTPGSVSPFSTVKSSIDYALSTKRYALFFLSNNTPLTPRGVVYLNITDEERFKTTASGEEIVKFIDTADPQFNSDETKEIMQFVKGSKVTLATEENAIQVEKSNSGIIILATLLAAAAISVGIVVYRKIKA
jgi:hypothetical protein